MSAGVGLRCVRAALAAGGLSRRVGAAINSGKPRRKDPRSHRSAKHLMRCVPGQQNTQPSVPRRRPPKRNGNSYSLLGVASRGKGRPCARLCRFAMMGGYAETLAFASDACHRQPPVVDMGLAVYRPCACNKTERGPRGSHSCARSETLRTGTTKTECVRVCPSE